MITVYPTKASSLFITHPSYGPLIATGSVWPEDSSTMKWLAKNYITTAAPKVASKEAPKAVVSKDEIDTVAPASK